MKIKLIEKGNLAWRDFLMKCSSCGLTLDSRSFIIYSRQRRVNPPGVGVSRMTKKGE